MEISVSSPIEIKTRQERFESSSYLSSFESYRRSYGYAYERRSINPQVGKSPDRASLHSSLPRESLESSSEFPEVVPLLESEPKSSTSESIFNAVNILMGIGILSLPYALKLTGWIIGITLMVLFALATRYTAITVKKCLDVDVPPHLPFDECCTFGDFGEVAFGPIGRRIISTVFQLELFAASVALVILSSDSIVALFPNLNLDYVKIGVVVLVMPMTFFSSLKFASYGSFFGVLALFNLVIIILYDGFSTNVPPGSILSPAHTSLYPVSYLEIPLAFGLIMSGFSGHSVFPSLYRDMKNPNAYVKMVNISYIITTFTYLLIGIFGYLMFGNDVQKEISLSLTNTIINRSTIWMIALNPLTKYPLTIHPVNVELSSWLKSKYGLNSKVFSRIFLACLVLGVSILIPGFDLVMSIIGSTFSFTVSIVFPEACYNKLYNLTRFQKLVSYTLIICGLLTESMSVEVKFRSRASFGFQMGKSTTDDFALKHKRENDLPLSLVDCKLLDFPWAQDRHYKYEINSMVLGSRSKQYLPIQKSEISAQTLEMTNYALNPTQVKKVAKSKREIDPKDLVLLTPKGSSDVQKSRPIVPWLRRTEYVSSESKQYGKASTMSKQKQRSRLSVEDIIEEGRSRVEHTFNAAAKVQLSDLKHPAGLKATEILPVFPDFEFWPNVYTLAAFDEDPCKRWDVKKADERHHEIELEEAVLKPMALPDDPEHPWMAYFSPNTQSILAIAEIRRRMAELGEDEELVDDQNYEYNFVRDFTLERVSNTQFPIYIELRKDEGAAFYNKTGEKLNLKRKRLLTAGENQGSTIISRPNKIHLKKRPLTEEEITTRQGERESFGF